MSDVIDQAEFRRTLGHFCTGVVIVTGNDGGKPVGFTAQSLVSLSLSPPLIGVSPSKTSSSWQRIRRTGRFCVNILTHQQRDLASRFAGPAADRFGATQWRYSEKGLPILASVMATITCSLQAEHDTGDHLLAVGHVDGIELLSPEAQPLLFYRGILGHPSIDMRACA